MSENYNEKDIASTLSDHTQAKLSISNWDSSSVTTVSEDVNSKYNDFQDKDKSKSNDYTTSSYDGVLHDSLRNEVINKDNASSDYQSNNDHHINQNNQNNWCANKNSDHLGIENPEEPLKSIHIPPEFEENYDLTIETGSNFAKYDKIEVIASGTDVPQKISSFQSAGLHEIILINLKNCNYTTPTPVQSYSLPIIMNGRDMIASAQSGSGKSAGYILPILNRLLSDPSELVIDYDHCKPRVLIMCPTTDFAIQVYELATWLSRGTGIKCDYLYGGWHFRKEQFMRGVHILVATPGRLIYYLNQGCISLLSLRYFILDEADIMLEMGFQLDIERILWDNTVVLSAERNILIFSATLPDSVKKLANDYLNSDNISIAVGKIDGRGATHSILELKSKEKLYALNAIVDEIDHVQDILIFVTEQRVANYIAALLCEFDYPAISIHGGYSYSVRKTALKEFQQKKIKIVVSTSVSKALDVTDIKMVINFDLPKTIKEYVHQIGYIERLDSSGKYINNKIISFYDPEKDQRMALDLADTLRQADQAIPPFLIKLTNNLTAESIEASDICKDVADTFDDFEID